MATESPALAVCEGCYDALAESEHVLTYRDGTTDTARYCGECLALAKIDHSGTIAAVDGNTTTPA
jgi:hypothetical protein